MEEKQKIHLVSMYCDAPDGKIINGLFNRSVYDYDHAIGLLHNFGQDGFKIRAAWFKPFKSKANQKLIPKEIIEQAILNPHPYHQQRFIHNALEMLPHQAHHKPTLKPKQYIGNTKLDFDYFQLADFKSYYDVYNFIIKLTNARWNKQIRTPKNKCIIYLDGYATEIDYTTNLMLRKVVEISDFYNVFWQIAIDGLLEINTYLYEETFTKNDYIKYHMLKIVTKSHDFKSAYIRQESKDRCYFRALKSVKEYGLFMKEELGIPYRFP